MPLIFPACILHKIQGKRYSYKETKQIFLERMDAWEAGRFVTLVRSLESHSSSGLRQRPGPDEVETESMAKRCDAMVKDGKLRPAIRTLIEREGGKLLRPTDHCSKTGLPVLEVLRNKHPDAIIPADEDFDAYSYEPDSLGISCYEEDIQQIVRRMSGGAGPSGVDAELAKDWLLRHKVRSEELRVEIAHWTMVMANRQPDYATYRGLNAGRMLASDKEPGVRPICCGEIWLCLIYKAAIDGEAKTLARRACGNVQLCAGLQAGIEGNLHALKESWPESGGWTFDAGTAEQPTPKRYKAIVDGVQIPFCRRRHMGEA